jgi:GntR family transcriptional regulator
MYAQLAMVLRSKIMSGEWGEGRDIPALGELCGQYSVARVTARQAVQMLVQEGLLSSHRGRRTFVTYCPPLERNKSLVAAFGSPKSVHDDFEVKVLEVKTVAALKEAPFTGIEDAPYQLIRKVDLVAGEPYALSENYVSKRVFNLFPKRAYKTSKISNLVHDAVKISVAREQIRVGAADFLEASELDCPISAPVALVRRVFCDEAGRAVYFSKVTYSGEGFVVEHVISAFAATYQAPSTTVSTASRPNEIAKKSVEPGRDRRLVSKKGRRPQ